MVESRSSGPSTINATLVGWALSVARKDCDESAFNFGVGREKWELQSGGHPRLEEDSSRQVQSWMVFVAQEGLALSIFGIGWVKVAKRQVGCEV